jgi:hypothetical protein
MEEFMMRRDADSDARGIRLRAEAALSRSSRPKWPKGFAASHPTQVDGQCGEPARCGVQHQTRPPGKPVQLWDKLAEIEALTE